MTAESAAEPTENRPSGSRPAKSDPYLDALRAGALLVVVFGHWLATLPRFDERYLREADHLLTVWPTAGYLTWALQVVPLFIAVSAAVSVPSASRVLEGHGRLSVWWAGRGLRLARPTLTYLAALVALLGVGALAGWSRWLSVFDTSLTVHLWFLVALLMLQLYLPLGVRVDRRAGLWPIAALAVGAVLVDVVRASAAGPVQLADLGSQVTSVPGGIGWVNWLLVWLVPQQLGVAWRAGRLGGWAGGAGLCVLGGVWLAVSVSAGYPVAMVGGDLSGSTNVLPPTAAFLGVVWLQLGVALLLEPAVRRVLSVRTPRTVVLLTALGMPLYLWHKLAELPAAWLAARTGLVVDAGAPGDAGFWLARGTWILLALLMVVPVMGGVVAFERRRTERVEVTAARWRVAVGGTALLAGLVTALALGTWPGAVIGAACVAVASQLLRQHGGGRPLGTDGDSRSTRARTGD